MHIRISRKALYWTLGTLTALGLVACYFLGDYVTPRDAEGRPLIYSPSVRSAEQYRRSVRRWVDDLAEIDARLEALLGEKDVGDPAQLYTLSTRAERLVKDTAVIVQDVEFTAAPPSLVGLHHQAQITADTYFAAAQDAALWVGAPQDENWRIAIETLEEARYLWEQLISIRWLEDDDVPL